MPEQPKVKFVEPEDGLFETYSSTYIINWTGYDVQFRFGRLKEINETGGLVIEYDVKVRTSWAMAKEFCCTLTSLIQEFEKVNGPIKTPQIPILPPPPNIPSEA